MSNRFKPSVDQWYSRPGKDEMFRVVAVDDGTIEIQRFDGDLEELDLHAWRELDIELAEPPEDWTGPFDNIEADDVDDTGTAMRKGDGHARVEPQFREGEAWQDARPTDEPEEEDDGTEPSDEDERASEDERAKRH